VRLGGWKQLTRWRDVASWVLQMLLSQLREDRARTVLNHHGRARHERVLLPASFALADHYVACMG
jgi:hypothetical protein